MVAVAFVLVFTVLMVRSLAFVVIAVTGAAGIVVAFPVAPVRVGIKRFEQAGSMKDAFSRHIFEFEPVTLCPVVSRWCQVVAGTVAGVFCECDRDCCADSGEGSAGW